MRMRATRKKSGDHISEVAWVIFWYWQRGHNFAKCFSIQSRKKRNEHIAYPIGALERKVRRAQRHGCTLFKTETGEKSSIFQRGKSNKKRPTLDGLNHPFLFEIGDLGVLFYPMSCHEQHNGNSTSRSNLQVKRPISTLPWLPLHNHLPLQGPRCFPISWPQLRILHLKTWCSGTNIPSGNDYHSYC